MKTCSRRCSAHSVCIKANVYRKLHIQASTMYLTVTYLLRPRFIHSVVCVAIQNINVNKMMCVHLVVMKCAPTEFTIIMYLWREKKKKHTHAGQRMCASVCIYRTNEDEWKFIQAIQQRTKNEFKQAHELNNSHAYKLKVNENERKREQRKNCLKKNKKSSESQGESKSNSIYLHRTFACNS